MIPSLPELTDLIRRAAREELLPRFANVARHHKNDGSVITVADGAMQNRLTEELREAWPDFRLLGEEMTDQEQAALMEHTGTGLWILDPLDGTSNFAAGIPYFSVSLALIKDGRVVVGVVLDPVRDECFSAGLGQGAYLDGEPLTAHGNAPPLQRCIAAIDFKRLPAPLATRLARHPPYSSQRSFGSIALDWCWVAAGRFHVYLHGRQKLWDYAAGQLILAEAGGYAETLDGEPVFTPVNRPRSALIALEKGLFREWRDWLRSAPGE